jgi:hypothetical protein
MIRTFPRVARSSCFGALVVSVALFSTGCSLLFEKETMILTQRSGSNQARLLLVYEGLHAASFEEAKELLSLCFHKKRGFFLGSPVIFYFFEWPNAFDKQAESKREKQFRTIMERHVSIPSAELFLNPNGKLCGWQLLAIHEPEKLVSAINSWFTGYFGEMAARGLANKSDCPAAWDKESLLMLQNAAKHQFAWFRWEPGRVSFTLPCTQALFTKLKRDRLFAWEDSWEIRSIPQLTDIPIPGTRPTATDAKSRAANVRNKEAYAREVQEAKLQQVNFLLSLLSEAPLSVDQRRDRMTVAVGVGDGEPMRIIVDHVVKPSQDKDEELIAYARKLVGRLEQHPADERITSFLKDK